MPFVNSNFLINVYRPIAPTSFGEPKNLQVLSTRIPARISFGHGVFTDADGETVETDAQMRIDAVHGLQRRDVVEVLPETSKRYRVERIRDVRTAQGRLTAFDVRLKRAEDLES